MVRLHFLRDHGWNVFVQACALLSDLKILEDGDESEIGERGVSAPPPTMTGAFY